MADDPLFQRFGKAFPPGTVLFQEGEKGNTMFILQTGEVKITKHDRLLNVLREGACFGEMAYIRQGSTRHASIEATTDVLLAEFEKELSASDLHLIEEKLSGTTVRQQTPQRVMHRRADLIRERYIYKVKVKKVSLKRALLEIRCQGGLYVKELVSGDEGRTNPNVSDLLNNRAKTLRLDVLNVIME